MMEAAITSETLPHYTVQLPRGQSHLSFYLCICCLFNDAVNTSNYIMSNDRMINEWKDREHHKKSQSTAETMTMRSLQWHHVSIFVSIMLSDPEFQFISVSCKVNGQVRTLYWEDILLLFSVYLVINKSYAFHMQLINTVGLQV
jgi:hypothetical protein